MKISRIGRRGPPRPAPGRGRRQHHRVEVLHVDCAAAPNATVDDLAGERWHRPVGRLGRHHIQVAVHQKWRQRCARLRVPSRATTDVRRGRAPQLASDTDLVEQLRDVLGSRARQVRLVAKVRRCRSESAAGRARQPRRPAGNPQSPNHLHPSCGWLLVRLPRRTETSSGGVGHRLLLCVGAPPGAAHVRVAE